MWCTQRVWQLFIGQILYRCLSLPDAPRVARPTISRTFSFSRSSCHWVIDDDAFTLTAIATDFCYCLFIPEFIYAGMRYVNVCNTQTRVIVIANNYRAHSLNKSWCEVVWLVRCCWLLLLIKTDSAIDDDY